MVPNPVGIGLVLSTIKAGIYNYSSFFATLSVAKEKKCLDNTITR
jgi:hypothetical protein